jgi:hypothetical protein
VPVSEPASVAVTVWTVPATVEVVNETVAMPLAFVSELALAKEPPAPVFDQVTLRPDVDTALPFASASCALIVTAAPATADPLLLVTRYLLAAPGTVVIELDVPVIPGSRLSVAVTVWTVPDTVDVVKETVATPLAFVVEVPDANEPPAPDFDHATIRPDVETALPFVSAS